MLDRSPSATLYEMFEMLHLEQANEVSDQTSEAIKQLRQFLFSTLLA